MNNQQSIKEIISQFSGQANIITVPKIFVEALGDYDQAILLNQLIFWSDKSKRKDGYFYKSYPEWEEELYLSKYKVRKAIKVLTSLKLVETKLERANGSPTLHYKVDMEELSLWIVKKLNYGKLRNLTMDSEETSQSITYDNNSRLQQYIKHNVELDLNDVETKEKEEIPYKEVIEYLNDKADKNFRNVESNNKHIRARFNEGYNLKDFEKVIDVKTSQWKNDENMSKYLRPTTLFGTKFDNYLNEEIEEVKVDTRNYNAMEKEEGKLPTYEEFLKQLEDE